MFKVFLIGNLITKQFKVNEIIFNKASENLAIADCPMSFEKK